MDNNNNWPPVNDSPAGTIVPPVDPIVAANELPARMSAPPPPYAPPPQQSAYQQPSYQQPYQQPTYQQPVYQQPSYQYIPQAPADPPANGLAIASLVLGILGLTTSWLSGFGSIPAIVGLILGCVAKKQGNKTGVSTAGIVLNVISLSVGLLVIGCIACAAFATSSSSSFSDYYTKIFTGLM